MPEWSKGLAWKASVRAIVPGVRIPSSPPRTFDNNLHPPLAGHAVHCNGIFAYTEDMKTRQQSPEELFPKGFFWGSATSSHQVEGGTDNQWSAWEKRNAGRLAAHAKMYWQVWQQERFSEMHAPKNYLSGEASDQYRRYKEDIALAASLGHTAYRFSIEWSRIQPQEGAWNEEAVEHYRDVVRTLRTYHMEPFVTLWHWTVPHWFARRGDWQHKNAPQDFAAFAGRFAAALPDVRFWMTLNEPMVYAGQSYLKGAWPPQYKNPVRWFRVVQNLIRGHNAASAAIKAALPSAQVGIAKNNAVFAPLAPTFLSRPFAALPRFLWNAIFLKHTAPALDFIGLNYYMRPGIRFFHVQDASVPRSDLGWELHPAAIRQALRELAPYHKPVYITESGLADADDHLRPWYLLETLKAVRAAMDDGVDVQGYFHWSLLDNMEWDKGRWPRFGLVAVDYATQKRTPRHSAYLYRDIIYAGGITDPVRTAHKACCLR